MGDDKPVKIRFHEGDSRSLPELIAGSIRRMEETGQAVSLRGHTLDCPYSAVEFDPPCTSCEHDATFWDPKPCKLGIPQNADCQFPKDYMKKRLLLHKQ